MPLNFRSIHDVMASTRAEVKIAVLKSGNIIKDDNNLVYFDEYEDIKPGEKVETTVTEVKEGTQDEFRTDNYWAKVEDTPENIEKMKKAPAIEVTTGNGASMVINLPAGKRVSPKSNLGCWKATYGDYPTKDQKVTTKVDDNGFNRIVLEK